jgi:hypothetical protein
VGTLRVQERLLARTPGGGAVGTPSVGTPLSGSSAQSTPARGYAAQDEGYRGAAALAAALAAAAATGSPADLSLDAFLVRRKRSCAAHRLLTHCAVDSGSIHVGRQRVFQRAAGEDERAARGEAARRCCARR